MKRITQLLNCIILFIVSIVILSWFNLKGFIVWIAFAIILESIKLFYVLPLIELIRRKRNGWSNIITKH
jgi:hypothetical protein